MGNIFSRTPIIWPALWLCALLWGAATVAHAADVEVLQADLSALIDQAAKRPEQFAVNIPHRVSSSSAGVWTQTGATSTWHYAVQVPTAISMSFHLAGSTLPASAVLTASGANTSVTYRARDIARGQLWGRPLIGDTLQLSLTISNAERPSLQLQLDSVQAGYRGFGKVPDHPRFARLKATAAATTPPCVENFVCHQDGANAGPARATVAVLIGNLYQCTGTLLNNARNDFTPYVLTARHCQLGDLGGGDPNAAASVSIYWNAVTACGSTLDSIYSGAATVQYGGATTVVEQQDAWLLLLNAAPSVQDAYWAGWDATGGTFTGGYSVHHAMGQNKQFVQWYGQALSQRLSAATLKVGYASDFWGVVNQIGSVGAGASGGALFDPNNRVVGSASLAALQNGADSTGVCPVTPTPVPSPGKVTAQYTAFSAVFASTADATSSTHSTTMQSVLDPDHTNQMRIDGLAPLAVTFSVDKQIPFLWQSPVVTWSAPGAQSCTPSGGVAGDGWSGSLPGNGSLTLKGTAAGRYDYTITCSGPGLKGSAKIEIVWNDAAPAVSMSATNQPLTIGAVTYIYFESNIVPCTYSGGTPGDGWSGTVNAYGRVTVTPTRTGNIDYIVTCGSGTHTASAHAVIPVVPMSVTISAEATSLRVGSSIFITWKSGGDGGQCSGVGGSASDHWADQVGVSATGTTFVTESIAGTYTYGMHCTSGGQTADASVNVTFTNDPAVVTLTALSPTQTVYASLPAPATPNLRWSSNVAPCGLSAIGPLGNTGVGLEGQYPGGTASDQQIAAGTYTYELHCGAQTATATITWVNPHPTVTVTADTTTWAANQQYLVDWTSNTFPCTMSGGTAGDGWNGNAVNAHGPNYIAEPAPGTYTLTLNCGSGISAGSAHVTVTVPAPAVTISASYPSVPQDAGVDISWNSTVAPCKLYDTAFNTFGVDVLPSGTQNYWERDVGTITYTVKCGSGNQAVQASTDVTVTAGGIPTQVSASIMTAVINTPVTLTWSSSGAGACSAAGGNGSDGWTGPKPASGTQTVTSAEIGLIPYVLNCGPTTSQTQVNYIPPGAVDPKIVPSVTLRADKTSQTVGSQIMLTWNSQNADSCTAAGGRDGDGWTGNLAITGSLQITENSAGAVTYDISCTGAPPAASAQVTVNFAAAGDAASGSGKSGGGSMDWWTLLAMSGMLGVGTVGRQRRR